MVFLLLWMTKPRDLRKVSSCSDLLSHVMESKSRLRLQQSTKRGIVNIFLFPPSTVPRVCAKKLAFVPRKKMLAGGIGAQSGSQCGRLLRWRPKVQKSAMLSNIFFFFCGEKNESKPQAGGCAVQFGHAPFFAFLYGAQYFLSFRRSM